MSYSPRMFSHGKNQSGCHAEMMGRRAGDMRTYAQDTALPGGKYEEGDIDSEGTAVSHPVPMSLETIFWDES